MVPNSLLDTNFSSLPSTIDKKLSDVLCVTVYTKCHSLACKSIQHCLLYTPNICKVPYRPSNFIRNLLQQIWLLLKLSEKVPNVPLH